MTEAIRTLTAAACAVLQAAEPADKIRLTRLYGEAWKSGALTEVGDALPPDRPARPAQPELLPPKDMPKRSKGGTRGRIALLHALAHIELNAIDLAWDIVARFAGRESLPREFYDDWVQVAIDEALHFELLERRLADLDAAYGDLPAHDGLWQAATATAGDVLDRLALVPMTHEARGLDTTPPTMARLTANGDAETVAVLDVIYRDEITHVAAGVRWFRHVCAARGLDPQADYDARLARLYPGGLKGPFNGPAREEAGMPAGWYGG
ncbi:MAG: ferritin-like domain-containing protein [Caenispirillum bisanense]|nr:ferritin-like domain-containing protein [Caenispirillum bisanense]MCA1973197.1 ferritin-like domain-containing protein [Caenispirillum sp.]